MDFLPGKQGKYRSKFHGFTGLLPASGESWPPVFLRGNHTGKRRLKIRGGDRNGGFQDIVVRPKGLMV